MDFFLVMFVSFLFLFFILFPWGRGVLLVVIEVLGIYVCVCVWSEACGI